MNAERTVVHVLTHSTYNRSVVDYNFTDGWHAKLGRNVANHSDYRSECWLIDYDASDERIKHENGVTFRLFPSRRLPKGEFSLPLLRAMRRRIRDDGRVGFHLHSARSLHAHLLPPLFRRVPTFLHHHGGLEPPPIIGYPPIERTAFSFLDHVFVLTEAKRRVLTDTVGVDPARVSIQTMGVDFDQFRPRDVAPADLGLDCERLLLYVGRYQEVKGLDDVLTVAADLSTEDVSLVLIGGNEEDPLYERASQQPNVEAVTEWVPTDRLVDYYSAADAYVSFPSEMAVRGGHCGVISPVEALACGTPVVSPTLQLFPEAGRDRVGTAPTTTAALRDALARWLDRSVSESACRDFGREHFSWESVVDTVTDRYDATFAAAER